MPDNDNRSASENIRCRVIQVSNISPSATREQLHQMFSYLGRISELKLYPSETNPLSATAFSKLCFIKYTESESVATAQHLTNTPLIDRAIICVPVSEDRIPDEETALRIGGPALPGQRMLPSHVINQIQQTMDGQQVMVTIDPTMSQLGVPNYPPLPSNTDATKLEEIRRTVYVGNIPKDASTEEILDFFNKEIGEVMYMRFAGGDDLPVRYLFVEFASQTSVPIALQKNGTELKGAKIKIQHSTQAIVKPRPKTQDMAEKEVAEAARRAEASGPMDDVIRKYGGKNSLDSATMRAVASITRSRSPSWGRGSRGRSRSPRRRRISRSPSPPRSRRYSPRRSPSPRRRSSRDRDRRPSPRDRYRDRRQRSPSPSEARRRRSRDRDRDRDRDRNRRDRSRDRKDKERDRDRDRDRDQDREKNKDKDKRGKDKDSKEGTKESSSGRDKKRQDDSSKSKSTEEKLDTSASSMEAKSVDSVDAVVKEILGHSKPQASAAEEQNVVAMDIEEAQSRDEYPPIQPAPTKSSAKEMEDPFGMEEADMETESAPAPAPMMEEEKHGKRKKEKRKKEKKEKKRKREKSSRKKKSKKNETGSASEDDGVSSSSSDE